MTRSQTQDGLTKTYSLDAAGRQRERVESGTKSATEVYHYAGGSDPPAWIQEGSAWTRNISSFGGLGAIEKSNGETALHRLTADVAKGGVRLGLCLAGFAVFLEQGGHWQLAEMAGLVAGPAPALLEFMGPGVCAGLAYPMFSSLAPEL
jgi:hypothetical protein